ncbi:NAD-dependent epimerase/dehydratase family protein [Oligella urethralis]|uniref:NAD-dependent epimerase/dehydratase family protein n=1 Tax=Oligella urethralis TaxID=90245 RepID=UPI000E00BD87|nr:NAD(P)-dependent oxidoreductase [Oligella urethralis]SUA57977.1 dTDP-glucose 4,6-dehydratase [Oligella urethralis]
MKAVITGSTGLLGRYVRQVFESNAVECLSLSRKSQDKFGTFYTDYSVKSLSTILDESQVVIHLAGCRSEHSSILGYRDEVEILQNLLDVSLKQKVKSFILASSISVYSGAVPFRESDIPAPKSKYGLNKLLLEHICRQFNDKYALSVVVLRLSHLFGANEKNNYMINLFMRKAFSQTELQVQGASTKRREFLYAKDAAETIYKVCQKNLRGFHILNVPGSEALTNLEVARKINLAFSNNALRHEQKEKEDPFSESYMSREKILEILGASPETSFLDAMKEIYEEMKLENDVPILY